MSIGDFDVSSVIYFKFTTYRPSTGATFTLGGTPALSVYKDNSTTQSTTGVTLTADFDTVTGLNHVAIDTSADGTFYSAGSFFDVVITIGTVDSVSVTGSVVGRFTLRKTSALKPTTAGRTLDVSAGGEAGIDWANVGSPTTVVGLTGTTIKTATDVETDTADIQTRLPAALVSGRIDASVGAIAANAITAASIAADAGAEIAGAVWDEDATGHQTGGTFGQAIGDPGADTNTIFKAVVTDATGATVGVDAAAILADTGTDGVLIATGAIGASQFAAGAVDAAALAASAGEEIADTILLRKLDRSGNGTDATDERTVVNALRALRNKQSIAAGTLTVTKENDLTTAWTAAVTTTAGDPLSAIDPT